MRMYFILFATASVFLFCGKPEQDSQVERSSAKNVPIEKNCDATPSFTREDSTGIFRGRVVYFADTSYRRSQGGLLLTTAHGDTVNFHFDYQNVKNLDPKKIELGACVEISYYAEIQRVEVDSSEDGKRGDEISRHFYISDIKYLN